MKKLENHWKEGLLYCKNCDNYKEIECFSKHPNKPCRNYRDARCKDCEKLRYEKTKELNRGEDIFKMLSVRYKAVLIRASAAGFIVDFGEDYLFELLEKQKGLCAISGVKMTGYFFEGRTHTNISVDRIDSSKGYLKDNIQLVCMTVNEMKNDKTHQDFIMWCQLIINFNNN